MSEYNTNELHIKHPGLNAAMKYLLQQVLVSIPYCIERWGENNTIYEIWRIGKSNLTYRNDIEGTEQFQSVGTMFEDNIHGMPGAGDCDCFTIFTVAMLIASGHYRDDTIYIYLQGNKKTSPSHILTMFGEKNPIFLDFTQPSYNTIRDYKFYDYKKINVK